MKAIRFHEFGPPEVLRLDEVPVPAPVAGEVRVRVRAAGVNPVDWKIRSGAARELVPVALPAIPGTEIAGEIDAVGEGVVGWTQGEAVMAFIGLFGGYAQYVCIPSTLIARMPDNVSFAQAAGAPLSILTAWGALTEAARLGPDQRLLVVGGAGAVGSFAIQIAKRLGGTVVASSSSASRARVCAQGADEILAYDAPEENRSTALVDVMLDCVGADAAIPLLPLLKPDGLYVGLSYPSDVDAVRASGYRATWFAVEPDGERLADLARRIGDGELSLPEPLQLPLAEASAAQALSASGHAPSRIVLMLP